MHEFQHLQCDAVGEVAGMFDACDEDTSRLDDRRIQPDLVGDQEQVWNDAKRFASEVGLGLQKGPRELRQREDAQDDVQTVADESKVVQEQVDKTMRTCNRS